MNRPTEVKALDDFRIWIRFADGTEGEVDLSDLAGRGVFDAWQDPAFYAGVYIGPGGSIAWSDLIELCPDSVFLRLSGKKPEDLFPRLAARAVHA